MFDIVKETKGLSENSINFALLWMSVCAKCGSVYHKSHELQYDENSLNKTKIVCKCGYIWFICHGHTTHKKLEKLHYDLYKGKEISRRLKNDGI